MFRRRRQPAPGPADAAPVAPDPLPGERAAPARSGGPWDASEVAEPGEGGRIDLGGVWLPGRPGMELRVEVDQQTQQVASVAAVLGSAAVQVQAFAAPRSEGIWADVRREIGEGVTGQGGRAEEAEGPFGTELRARIPVRLPDGTAGAQPVRFVGVDGPRWFLRGVFSGDAATDPAAAAPLEEVFRDVVVVRGSAAMPPREPIPLHLPESARGGPGEPGAGGPGTGGHDEAPGGGAAQTRPAAREPLAPFARGPEITEVR